MTKAAGRFRSTGRRPPVDPAASARSVAGQKPKWMLAYQVLRGRSLHRDRTTGSARSIAASADLSLPTRRRCARVRILGLITLRKGGAPARRLRGGSALGSSSGPGRGRRAVLHGGGSASMLPDAARRTGHRGRHGGRGQGSPHEPRHPSRSLAPCLAAAGRLIVVTTRASGTPPPACRADACGSGATARFGCWFVR